MIFSAQALSVKLWFDEACEVMEVYLPLGLALFLFVLDFMHSPVSCFTRNATAAQAAFVEQSCYSQLSSGVWKSVPSGEASYEPVAQGSVHHAYVSLFLLVFVFLVKVPDIFYTRLCLPEFESLIGQITVELRRVAAFVEDERDVSACTRTLRHVDSVLLLDILANLQRSTRFFAAYALKHGWAALVELFAIALVSTLLAMHRGMLFSNEFDCRLRRQASERVACTLTHATVLNYSCLALLGVACACLLARAAHMHVHFAPRRFRNAHELRFLRTPLGSLIRALAYSRYSHAVHQVRAIHANLATGFSLCDLHFLQLLLAASPNRLVLQFPARPAAADCRSSPAPSLERLTFAEAMQVVQYYVDRFMLLHDHRVGVRFGRNAFGFLKTEEISDRLDFTRVSIRFEFQDFYA